MEGTVSNVEVCNFAYTGQFDKLKQCILTDKSLACKTDQVRKHVLRRRKNASLCFPPFLLSTLCDSRTIEPPCIGLVLLATPTLWSFCLTWELK